MKEIVMNNSCKCIPRNGERFFFFSKIFEGCNAASDVYIFRWNIIRVNKIRDIDFIDEIILRKWTLRENPTIFFSFALSICTCALGNKKLFLIRLSKYTNGIVNEVVNIRNTSVETLFSAYLEAIFACLFVYKLIAKTCFIFYGNLRLTDFDLRNAWKFIRVI